MSYILYRDDIIAIRDDEYGFCLYKSLQDSTADGNVFCWVQKIGNGNIHQIGTEYHLEDVDVALLMKVKYDNTKKRDQIIIKPEELDKIQQVLDKSKSMYPDDVVMACSDDDEGTF